MVFADSPGSALNGLVKNKGYAFEKVETSPFEDDLVAEVQS